MLFFSLLSLYLDHEKTGKSTTSFTQKFINTLPILKVSKDFLRKLCKSVLYDDVPFIAAINLIVNQLLFKN